MWGSQGVIQRPSSTQQALAYWQCYQQVPLGVLSLSFIRCPSEVLQSVPI